MQALLLVGGIHLLLIVEDPVVGVDLELTRVQWPVTLLRHVGGLQVFAPRAQARLQPQILQLGIQIPSSPEPRARLQPSGDVTLPKVLPL